MYVPMPFPYCNRCGKKWGGTAVHSVCGGELELDPDNRVVRCTRCSHSWQICDTLFHCPHEHVFAATEVETSINELIEDCRLVAEELVILQRSFSRRKAMGEESRREFVRGSLEGFGYSVGRIAGYAFERLVDFVLELFKGFFV